MVATAIVFFPAAPLFLFIHGKDITIPKGTEITAFVEGDTKLDLAKFAPITPATGVPPTPAATPSGLTVDSSVANCDIEVDGAFMGSTPSTLTLTPGKHDIVLKKAGYQDWTRSMTVGSGAVRLSADMVANNEGAMSERQIVIVAYKPKPGKEAELLQLTREHLPILRAEGLATERAAIAGVAADGTVVEVFEWEKGGTEKAHTNSQVLTLWQRYAAACDYVPLNNVAEAGQLFASFTPLEL